MMPDNIKNLYYLEDLPEFKVASENHDVRGWDVIDAEQRSVGKVTNLIVNIQEERVVYLDVEVDKPLMEAGYQASLASTNDSEYGFKNKDGDEHLLIPIGMVSLNKEHKQVLANQIDYNTFAKAKRFKRGDAIGHDYELILFRHYLFDEANELNIIDSGFYNRKEFDDSLHQKDAE